MAHSTGKLVDDRPSMVTKADVHDESNQSIAWQPPMLDCIYLNFRGATDTKKLACGLLFRDHAIVFPQVVNLPLRAVEALARCGSISFVER